MAPALAARATPAPPCSTSRHRGGAPGCAALRQPGRLTKTQPLPLGVGTTGPNSRLLRPCVQSALCQWPNLDPPGCLSQERFCPGAWRSAPACSAWCGLGSAFFFGRPQRRPPMWGCYLGKGRYLHSSGASMATTGCGGSAAAHSRIRWPPLPQANRGSGRVVRVAMTATKPSLSRRLEAAASRRLRGPRPANAMATEAKLEALGGHPPVQRAGTVVALLLDQLLPFCGRMGRSLSWCWCDWTLQRRNARRPSSAGQPDPELRGGGAAPQ